MPLLTLLDAELAYGLHPLLDRAGLSEAKAELAQHLGTRNRVGAAAMAWRAARAASGARESGEFEQPAYAHGRLAAAIAARRSAIMAA